MLRIVEPQQQLEHGRLARARRPDQGDALAWIHAQRESCERRRVGTRRIVERHGIERDFATRRFRQRNGVLRCRDLRPCGKQFEQALGGAGRALQVADDLADRAHRARDDHRVEHERRQFARAHAAGKNVMTADPQDHADGAEHQQDHRRDQRGAFA
jgi:hypothetical protein